jgi:N-acetylneuraminic acid mutarotase
MKTKSNLSGYVIRSAAAALLFLFALVALASALNLPSHLPKFPAPQNNTTFGLNVHESVASASAAAIQKTRTLTFADRVAYQRAIEEVSWRYSIWPEANAGSKPPLDTVMPRAQIEKKVEDYLRNSQALEDYWQRPITPDQLQAEMERIASHTQQPGVLREIFAALGNDPFVIAECLARPALAERLLADLYAHDQRFHGDLKRRAEAELRTHRSVSQMKQSSGTYSEVEWIKSDAEFKGGSIVGQPHRLPNQDAPDAIQMSGSEWEESVARLAAQFERGDSVAAGVPPAQPTRLPPQKLIAQIKTGILSPLQEDDSHYYALAVMKKGKNRMKLAAIAWLKQPLRSWVTKAEAQVPVRMAAVSADYTLPVISTPSNACTDEWAATSNTGAPARRYYHTAVWTGSEMIVWGGANGSGPLNTGGRYNPSTDTWTATSTTNAPSARSNHTAVWTGSEMIVWGGAVGSYFNTGGRYNPSTDTWTATSTTNAPDARYYHTAVWTGSEMIVWGGVASSGGVGSSYVNTGGRYDPSTDSWTATSTANAPIGRYAHTTVWSGSQMIVWGGSTANNSYSNTGGSYNPGTDSWTATSTTSPPVARTYHTAVWTGSEMVVWGGASGGAWNTGGRYNPGTDSWTPTSTTNVPAGREQHTAVWTGSEMIVWGGNDGNLLNTGGRYDPNTDSWTATKTTGAPDTRRYHTAVWTGSQMIVWGGSDINGNGLNTGGRYCGVQVTVQTTPAGLVFNVDGIDYSVAQTFSWAQGSSHPITTSTPQNGTTGVRYYFSSWSDGGAISHTVAPTKNTTYTAKFGTQYYLTMVAGTGGKVSPASNWKTAGTSVSISATPSAGYSFNKWTGSGAGSFSGTTNPVSITMNGPITETAVFFVVTVDTSPAGLSMIVDGQTYTAPKSFNWSPGSSHTIATTTPQSGAPGVRHYFSSWSDGGAISHTVTPTKSTTYTAKFGTQYYLTMNAGTGGTVSPASSWRTIGSTVAISAKPSTGYSFTNWTGTGTGSFSGTDNPASVIMNGPISETASFTHN